MRRYLQALERRKWVVLVAMVLVSTTSFVLSATQTPVYEASARLLLGQSPITDIHGSVSPASQAQSGWTLATQAELAETPNVVRRVLAAEPGSSLSVGEFLRDSNVTASSDSDVLTFDIRNADGRLAQRLANEYAHQFTLYRRSLETRSIELALDKLGTVNGSSLQDPVDRKAERLRTLEALYAAAVPLQDPATSSETVQPRPFRDLFRGLILGAILGLSLVALRGIDREPESKISANLDFGMADRPPVDRSHPRPASGFSRVRRSVAPWLLVAVASAVLGVALVFAPAVALIGACLVLVAALTAQFIYLPVALLFGGAVVMSSSLVDLPGKAQLGGFTANAALTAAYSFLGVLLVVSGGLTASRWPGLTVRRTVSSLMPFIGLLLLGLLSLTWGEPSIAGIQGVLVLLVFILCVLCGAAIAARASAPVSFAGKVFGWGAIAALTLYVASLASGGIGSGAVVGNRSFALFALLVIAWAVAGWRYRARFGRALTIAFGLAVLLSLSRVAFAAALVISCLAWINPRTFGGWFRFLAITGAGIALAYLAVQHIGPLHERIYAGDVRSIGGGISINLTGRSELWTTTWDSFITSPYLGHGAGSAVRLITDTYSFSIGHPHNDYLRLLHDYGVLGAFLWVVGYVVLLSRTWRSWQRPSTEDKLNQRPAPSDELRIHAAAFLALVGVAIAMITDNAIDYLFVMAPLGVLVGLSLGLTTRSPAAEPPPAGAIAEPTIHDTRSSVVQNV